MLFAPSIEDITWLLLLFVIVPLTWIVGLVRIGSRPKRLLIWTVLVVAFYVAFGFASRTGAYTSNRSDSRSRAASTSRRDCDLLYPSTERPLRAFFPPSEGRGDDRCFRSDHSSSQPRSWRQFFYPRSALSERRIPNGGGRQALRTPNLARPEHDLYRTKSHHQLRAHSTAVGSSTRNQNIV